MSLTLPYCARFIERKRRDTGSSAREKDGMWKLLRFKDQKQAERPSARPALTIHLGIYALMLAVTVPRLVRSFSPTGDTLDTSWTWMLGYGLQHRLQWGKSIIFTYGPLGFLTDSYFYSDHFLWGLAATVRLASWFIFGLGFAVILGRLAARKSFPRATVLGAIGWVIGASFLDLSTQSAVLGVLLLVLALAEEESAPVGVELALAGFLLALGALVKSTGLIVSLLALLVYPAVWRYAGRGRNASNLPLFPLLSFFVSFCALWVLSAQSLADLPAYFRGTWEIIRGYTPAMSIHGMRLQIVSALAILSLFAGALITFRVGGRKARVAQCLLLGGVAFWAWKEGFTLQDPGYVRHPMIFYGTTLLIASAGTALLSIENARYLKSCVYGAYAIALLSSMLGYPPSSLSFARVLINYHDYFALVSSQSRRAAEQRVQTAAIQRQFMLSDGLVNAVGHASMNVMPWSLMMAQGYGMRLVASPVIQTYSAYTSYLDHTNARQIWGGRSADKILYGYGTLGPRYPPFDEPATFRAMLTCYRTEYAGNPYSVLGRVVCTPPAMHATDDPGEGTLGTWIRVPLQASYVDINLRTTLIGDLKNILYKAPHIFISFGFSDGSMAGPYQLIYSDANDGLFIRYFIGSESDVMRLFSGNASGLRRIAGIQIAARPGSLDYAKRFGVQFVYENPPHRYLLGNADRPSIGKRQN